MSAADSKSCKIETWISSNHTVNNCWFWVGNHVKCSVLIIFAPDCWFKILVWVLVEREESNNEWLLIAIDVDKMIWRLHHCHAVTCKKLNHTQTVLLWFILIIHSLWYCLYEGKTFYPECLKCEFLIIGQMHLLKYKISYYGQKILVRSDN